MIKLGDKVKFDEYLNYNYITGKKFKYNIGKDKFRIVNRHVFTERTEKIVKYKEPIIKDELLEGVFIGFTKKKLCRIYKVSKRKPDRLENQNGRLTIIRDTEDGVFDPPDYCLTKYSKNPRRVDNPRVLDRIAIVKIKESLIGVPLINIYKNTFNNTYTIL